MKRLISNIAARLAVQYEKPGFVLEYNTAYAVDRVGKPSAKLIEEHRNVWQQEWSDNTAGDQVIIAFGMAAVKSLGIKARKIKDIRGTVMKAVINGREVTVVPTLSFSHVYLQPGLINIFLRDITLAAKVAYFGETVKPKTIGELSKDYIYPKSVQEVSDLVDMILAYKDPAKMDDADKWPISIDTETNTLKTYKPGAKVIVVSTAWDSGKAAAIILDHDQAPYDPREAWVHVKRLLESPKPKIFHNAKYDLTMLELVSGCKVNNVYWDSLCAEHFLDEDKKGFYGLKNLAPFYTPELSGYEDDLHEQLHKQEIEDDEAEDDAGEDAEFEEYKEEDDGKAKPQEDGAFERVDLNILLPYAAADADVTRELCRNQFRTVLRRKEDTDAHKVMDDLYIPGSRTLGRMEHRGCKIDLALLSEYETALTKLISETKTEIFRLAGKEFNINAAKQISDTLLNLNFELFKQTKKGKISTDKSVFVSLQAKYVSNKNQPDFIAGAITDGGRLRLVEALLLYKSVTKMKTSFIKNIRNYTAIDGRLHTSFNLNGTATGRLSSSRLNLQNLPLYMCRILRPDGSVVYAGFNVKSLIVPDTDNEVWFNLDIKSAELRVLAYYTQDAELIKNLRPDENGKLLDVHTYFMAKILNPGVAGDEILEKYRELKTRLDGGDDDLKLFRVAIKKTVFGTLYGAGGAKIAQQLGDVTPESINQAKKTIADLFAAFPTLKNYIDSTHTDVNRYGEVKTVFGRRRRFGLMETGSQMRSAAQREAVNFKIQSTSSDLVASQLVEIEAHAHEIGAKALLTVHDSISGTIQKSRVKELKPFLDKYMIDRIKEKFPWLPVDFSYDLEIGKNYGQHIQYSEYIKGL
jgi:DNA polymerase I-like protein with 3'-5' exonuclease and polymerase domains